MHALAPRPYLHRLARLETWARLWLVCIAALLNTATQILPRALQRRALVLDQPRVVLAGYVARLIFLCALDRATPPRVACRARPQSPPKAGVIRALLRAGLRRHLIDADGKLDLAIIARTCADPAPAIADMAAALERGLTRRCAILPRAACDAQRPDAPLNAAPACDSS